jgi:hypothetical protein
VITARRGVVPRCGGLRRGVARGLVDDQIAHGAGLGVLHDAARLLVGRRVADRRGARPVGIEAQRLGRREGRAQQAREDGVRGAEAALARDQVVVLAGDRAQSIREQRVGDLIRARAGQRSAGGVRLGDLDLLQHEVQVGPDQRRGLRLRGGRAAQKSCTQHATESGANASPAQLESHDRRSSVMGLS